MPSGNRGIRRTSGISGGSGRRSGFGGGEFEGAADGGVGFDGVGPGGFGGPLDGSAAVVEGGDFGGEAGEELGLVLGGRGLGGIRQFPGGQCGGGGQSDFLGEGEVPKSSRISSDRIQALEDPSQFGRITAAQSTRKPLYRERSVWSPLSMLAIRIH